MLRDLRPVGAGPQKGKRRSCRLKRTSRKEPK
jgi:hypothetical protein